MPSQINHNGTVTRRPGVRTDARFRSVAGRSVGAKRLAVVADMPWLEKAKPVEVSSPQAIQRLEPTSTFLAKVARHVYNPANDARVLGGPAAVVLVSPTPTTQATRTFVDEDGAGALTLNATAWGPIGNRTRVNLSTNGDDANALDVLIERDGVSETFTGVQSGSVLGFEYTGDDATAVALTYTRAGGLTIAQTMAAIALGTLNPTELVFAGPLTFAPSTGAAGGETYEVEVTGINADTGAEETETLTWVEADGTDAKVTTTEWSDVTSIVLSTDGASTPTFTLTNTAFDIDAEEDRTAADIADQVNAYSARGYVCTVESPNAAVILSTELDGASALDILAGAKYLRADLWALVNALGASNLVEAEVASGAAKPPDAVGSMVYLAGGTQAVATTEDWAAALAALERRDVQVVWPYSTTAAIHDELKAHCIRMAGAGVRRGAGERSAWVGAAANETLAQLKTRTHALNTRHVAFAAQEVRLRNPNGTASWHGPEWLALLLAAMQCAVPVGTPLTTKRPNVLDVRNNSGWSVEADIEELLDNGVVVLTDDGLGLAVERSITTYIPDDNDVYSEVSANESFDTSNRDVREVLWEAIGDPNFTTTAGRLATLARSALADQIRVRIIKAASLASLTVEDLGDHYVPNYEVAVVEPTNFVTTRPTVTRNPAD